MPYEIQIKDVPDQLVASVRRLATMSTVGKEIPEAFRELAEAVGPVGFGQGMPGVEYLGEVGPDTEWEMVVFVPVAERFEPPEEMEVAVLPGTTFASTIHRGPYEECGAAYDALRTWIAESEYEMAGPPRELYLNDPREEEEPLTEILFPVG
jgi:effector-binding domain-containing protein